MAFPKDFLEEIASENKLTPKQREVFLALYGESTSRWERWQIAEDIHITESTFNTRLTEVYRKFSISDTGPVKESRLQDYLNKRYRARKPDNSHQDSSSIDSAKSSIDALVQELRQRVQPYIQEKCGTMRVLDMSQPINSDEIYTSVNILEKITRHRSLESAELRRYNDYPEHFYRFRLGKPKELSVPGLEAVEKFSKLMILGKPGAGKTTFLKHLAIQCIGGKFQPGRVPLFITLKDFAEADNQPNLLEYISCLLVMPSIDTFQGNKLEIAEKILCAGKALIFLDGLDEVKDADNNWVLRQVRDFSLKFPQNQLIITCRIAALEYTFEQFTEVEIADFDDKQIADFAGKWFHSKNDPIKAEHFTAQLKEKIPVEELAMNPLLLTLLCLVFEDSGCFPSNRSELYKYGVDILLKKWDDKRYIKRDQIYKNLTVKWKKDLLSQIAYTTFTASNYFFKQREVEYIINQYIQNLPDASTDPQVLEVDSEAVLKSIEAQHGLLVERARGIYSFSHLTFHEYFTACKIVANCNPDAAEDPMLQELVSNITESRWREVFFLVVEMLPSSSVDQLLQLMKQQVDLIMAHDEKLQEFLRWIKQKSCELSNDYYPLVAIRFFYVHCECVDGLDLLSSDELLIADIFNVYPVDDTEIDSLDIDRQLYQLLGFSHCSLFSPKDAIPRGINYILDFFSVPSAIQNELQQLKDDLPEFPEFNPETEDFEQMWTAFRPIFTQQLRDIMIKYLNIGYDWQFSDEQRCLLIDYYNANEFLLECLDCDCYVSREVRQEIEDTLLLPNSDI